LTRQDTIDFQVQLSRKIRRDWRYQGQFLTRK